MVITAKIFSFSPLSGEEEVELFGMLRRIKKERQLDALTVIDMTAGEEESEVALLEVTAKFNQAYSQKNSRCKVWVRFYNDAK